MTAQTDLPLAEIAGSALPADLDLDLPEDRWPATLAEMVDVLVADSERNGVGREEAVARAQRAALVWAEHLGGRPVYLPRGDRLRQALRDRQIYLLHRGNNAHELADRFGLTVRHIERIYAEQRVLQIRKRQGRLFGE